jgi:ribosomal protein L11 methyltransferase
MENNITDQIYTEYTFTVTPATPWSDVIMSSLGELGFESFIETDHGFKAYVLQSIDHDHLLEDFEWMDHDLVDIAFAKAKIPPTNWNQEWEKNFDPIEVDGLCEVRAPFHDPKGLKYDIVIEPKMSFGTGHHQTTYMIIQHLLTANVEGLNMLDMGSGTGVLAILAQMRGAAAIDAIDIDTWCYENALENVQRNNADRVQVILGGAEQLEGKSYDAIIANINLNVLLRDIPTYAQVLKSGGMIWFSGFYTTDVDAITALCNENGLSYDSMLVKDNWAAVKMVKN